MTHSKLDAATSFPNADMARRLNRPRNSVEIVASSTDDIQHELDKAFRTVINQAIPEDERGILVTRHTLTTFTVELSPDVPRRTTFERDISQRTVKRAAGLYSDHLA
ncbi:hypothetical protein StoSoilB3_42290 (plasmid) [Arthrobacter sp. StoSoilB3]|nr:hypothetical protein StoSoilB3_42290 [Arthrobacter sp. StoSoilB3]